MLKRRCQRNKIENRPQSASTKISDHVDNTKRCHSDDSSSQSAQKKIPTFASVHRITRHHTSSLKCINDDGRNDAIQKQTKPISWLKREREQNVRLNMLTNVCNNATIRQTQRTPLYKLNTEMGMQQQQQQQQQQQNLQNAYLSRNKAHLMYEKQQYFQQQQSQQRNIDLRHRTLLQKNNTLVQQQNQLKRQHQQQQLQQRNVTENTTNNLYDIYKRNSLNQTVFFGQDIHVNQALKQQQYQKNYEKMGKEAKPNFSMWSQPVIQKCKQSLNILPNPLSHSIEKQSILEQNRFSNEQHFQFSDSYDEVSQFNTAALKDSNIPPPPAPINHLYETIKDRPRSHPNPLSHLRPLPPTPLDTVAATNMKAPPPLPPIRSLKKKFPLNSNNVQHNHKLYRKSDLEKRMENNQNSDAKSRLHQSPQNNTMTIVPASISDQKKTKIPKSQNDFSSTADNEQKYYHYQLANKSYPRKQQLDEKHENDNQLRERAATSGLETDMIEHPLGACKQRTNVITNNNNNYGKKGIKTLLSKSNNDTQMTMGVAKEQKESLYERHNFENIIKKPQQQQQQQQQQHKLLSIVESGLSNNSKVMSAIRVQQHQQDKQRILPSGLPIVMEESLNEYQHGLALTADAGDDGGSISTAKLPYGHGEIEVSLETAQAMAAAAYYAQAAQKLVHNKSIQPAALTNGMSTSSSIRNGGFCGALQRATPPMPSNLARRLANKENYAMGKVKVLLRVSDSQSDIGGQEKMHFMCVDKKKRQITLTDSTMAVLSGNINTATTQERAPMVAAPKMFAFDNLFTSDDQQMDVCASALSEVIPAVLEGSDGCLLTVGYPNCGQSQTMLGTVNQPNELGAIPCAISWLYKGINERRQKSGARFSVRVSALGVSPTKPDSVAKDLLVAHATDSDDSPGIYLCDDFLGGPTELRAPTAERAALFLDAALSGRTAQGGLEPAMIFTLHVYQYSLSRKGGVAGGRSRLHLIDLGGCANRSGGLPLSGIGNILLAILSGQRHPPNKDHPLTPLLKDCLAPMTCHVAIVAHVMHKQSHTDALTTIQLASRIHRLRRRKHRYPLNGACGTVDKAGVTISLNGHQATGSSTGSGADPSSSELSADTVIYMGPSGDATDGEHPPMYLPSLNNIDNREVLNKVLKTKSPSKAAVVSSTKKCATIKVPTYTIAQQDRTNNLKKDITIQPNNTAVPLQFSNDTQTMSPLQSQSQRQVYSPAHTCKTLSNLSSSPLRHVGLPTMCSKASNIPTPKNSPLRRPTVVGSAAVHPNEQPEKSVSPKRFISEECWVDGPRISRAKVAEARHLLREVNHVKQCETWIDGPKFQSTRSLTTGNLPSAQSQAQSYGFMDSHKKSMIRQWVEYQTSQVFHTASVDSSPTRSHRIQQIQNLRNASYQMRQLKQKSLDNQEDLFSSNTTQQQQQQQQKEKLSNDDYSLHNSHLDLINTTASHLKSITDALNQSQNSAQFQSQTQTHFTTTKEETNLNLDHSLHNSLPKTYEPLNCNRSPYLSTSLISDTRHQNSSSPIVATTFDCDEDQDSGPSEVPPALPLIEPLGSREISHESLHHILSHHISRESLYKQQQQELQQQQIDIRYQEEQCQSQRQRQRQCQRRLSHQPSTPHYSQQSIGRSDCCLQVTEEDIARTMATEHPLAALSHCDNISVISSFHAAGDTFSDSGVGGRTRSQFDQLARLHEIFTSQLAMAEVTPVFRAAFDLGSVYSEPAYRFNAGPGSLCSEPPYRPPSPRIPSRSSSHSSLPSLNGIMQIAGMEQYASLRHPDGASNPNLQKLETSSSEKDEDKIIEDTDMPLLSKRTSFKNNEAENHNNSIALSNLDNSLNNNNQSQLPLLPLTTSSEAYDSGHDSSTPRTSKHSGISRRAESGYHSVATVRDSDESSFTSGLSKDLNTHHHHITAKRKRQEKGLCTWLMNPFTCTYGETEGEISDF